MTRNTGMKKKIFRTYLLFTENALLLNFGLTSRVGNSIRKHLGEHKIRRIQPEEAGKEGSNTRQGHQKEQ